MPRPSLLLLVAVCALVHGRSADAAKVKVWHQGTAAGFEKAKFQRAVVTSEGALRLAPQVKPIAGLEAANVWAVVEDRQGNLYAGTGDDGKVYKVAVDGKVTVAHDDDDSQILSLVAAADGTVYAGTGPGGKIVRIPPTGPAQVVADRLDAYVWSLVIDAGGTVYAGTGPKGTIYRLPPNGKATAFYKARQEHILALGLDPKGTLYAGTDKGGLVYRIDPATGKGFVLFHASQPEVRALLVTADAVYAGTSAPVARKTGGKAADAGTGTGENAVYRIAPDGTVREVYRDKTMVLRLLRHDGRLLVATGMQGQLFAVDETTKERTELVRLDAGQINALLARPDGGLVLGSGDPGRLVTLEKPFAATGTVTSDVLDAKMPSRWGALTWKAETPAGTAATVAVRSGNVADPDETWSAWSAEQTDPAAARADAPTARYLQYRVTLTTDRPTATPTVRDLTVRYQTVNQAPEVTTLDVPDLDAANLDSGRKVKLKWAASDPNDDELRYVLAFRKDGWKDWVVLEKDLEAKTFDWDTTGVPSGWYQVKVTATDRHDNTADAALTAEKTSAAFPITHQPPAVTLKVVGQDGGRVTLEGTATDPYVRLTEAQVAVDGKKWVNVFPTDGLFDTRSETVRHTTDTLPAGTHVIVLRVRDAAGNVGAADVVIDTRQTGAE